MNIPEVTSQADTEIDKLLNQQPPAPSTETHPVNTPSATDSTPASTAVLTPSQSTTTNSASQEQLPTPGTTPDPPTHSSDPPTSSETSTSTNSISADLNTQNILPEGTRRVQRSNRQQIYTTALNNTPKNLTTYHTAFATGIQQIKGAEAKTEDLHQDTLPAEPHSWKQMLRHQFATEFKQAAQQEIQELEKRATFK